MCLKIISDAEAPREIVDEISLSQKWLLDFIDRLKITQFSTYKIFFSRIEDWEPVGSFVVENYE